MNPEMIQDRNEEEALKIKRRNQKIQKMTIISGATISSSNISLSDKFESDCVKYFGYNWRDTWKISPNTSL